MPVCSTLAPDPGAVSPRGFSFVLCALLPKDHKMQQRHTDVSPAISVVLSTACAILHFRAVFLWERTLSEKGSNPSTLPSATAVEGAASGSAGTSASSLKKGGSGKAGGAGAEGAVAEGKACCGEVEGVGGWWPWQWGVGEWSAAVAAWSLSFCPLMWQVSVSVLRLSKQGRWAGGAADLLPGASLAAPATKPSPPLPSRPLARKRRAATVGRNVGPSESARV